MALQREGLNKPLGLRGNKTVCSGSSYVPSCRLNNMTERVHVKNMWGGTDEAKH